MGIDARIAQCPARRRNISLMKRDRRDGDTTRQCVIRKNLNLACRDIPERLERRASRRFAARIKRDERTHERVGRRYSPHAQCAARDRRGALPLVEHEQPPRSGSDHRGVETRASSSQAFEKVLQGTHASRIEQVPLLLQNPRNSTFAGAGYLHDFARTRTHAARGEHACDLRRQSIARGRSHGAAEGIDRFAQALHHLRHLEPVRLESLISQIYAHIGIVLADKPTRVRSHATRNRGQVIE